MQSQLCDEVADKIRLEAPRAVLYESNDHGSSVGETLAPLTMASASVRRKVKVELAQDRGRVGVGITGWSVVS